MAAANGIEPPPPGSEPGVVPIDYAAMWSVWLEANQRIPELQSGALSLLATDAYGGTERYRTSILRFFRPPLRPRKLPFQMAERAGLEPADRVTPATRFPGGPTTNYRTSLYGDGGGRRTHKTLFRAYLFSGQDDVATHHPRHVQFPLRLSCRPLWFTATRDRHAFATAVLRQFSAGISDSLWGICHAHISRGRPGAWRRE